MGDKYKNDKKMDIAVFRFGIISELVTGVHFERGKKAQLIKEKANRSYNIPYSNKTRISISTIKHWIRKYKRSGNRLESLMPQERNDKGKYRVLSDNIQESIKRIKEEKPLLPGILIEKELQNRKILQTDEKLNTAVVYRFLKQENIQRPSADNRDRRAFEAEFSNQLWQSDVYHSIHVRDPADGKKKKAYLIAIIDDYSRLIVNAKFYFSEQLENFKDCFKNAILKRGLPQKLYIDNGACYKALNLEQVTALLGIGISHTPPYTPQGRGKIERWFRYVKDNFFTLYDKHDSIDDLNNSFGNWVQEYNTKVHSATKEIPVERYARDMHCVRPAPARILDYFRMIEFRRVKKDRTVQLNKIRYEVPVSLIDLKVELRFHKEDMSNIEVFYDNRSYGKATILDKVVNSKLGRDYTNLKDKDGDTDTKQQKITSGQLF